MTSVTSHENKSHFSYFHESFVVTILGLLLAYAIGHYTQGTAAAGLSAIFICAVLSVLEVSLSFDNAVVNASVLRNMNDVWRHRFLTWGILIAVFGMRLVFPLALVGIVAHIGPWDAIVMAATKPDDYAALMRSAHIPVAAFGGAFLLMVALKHFFKENKEVFWLTYLERPLSAMGKLDTSEIAVALLIVYAIAQQLAPADAMTFLVAGIFGLVTFILVDGVSGLLAGEDDVAKEKIESDIHRASAGMFLYLEVLDASFSFDGVVGAFAITNNLFIISIGLGIGAMFVRSLTILLVEKGTLTQFRYLEHGAFWAIGALAAIMFLNTLHHVSEMITGFIGAAFIGLSLWSSVRYNKKCGPTTATLDPISED
jgi:uncharacterized protein